MSLFVSFAFAQTPPIPTVRIRGLVQDLEKSLQVASDAPMVTSRPSDRSLLVPGASVSLFAQVIDGKPTALRVRAGRNSFVLPY